jgi:AcrR family transcriptional regulator
MSPQPPSRSEEPNPGPSRLPRGRHRLPFEVVAENQRRRLIAGAAQALGEQGYGALTVKHVIEAAGVSRTTFYANFDNKRDCVLAAHRDVFERLARLILSACATEREWPARVRAAIGAVFALAAQAPEEVRLLTLDALATDMMIARQVIDSNAHLAALLRDGRRHTPLGPSLPDLTEEALVGAVSAILGGRLLDGDAGALTALEPEIVQLLLTPYIGTREAARIAGSSE